MSNVHAQEIKSVHHNRIIIKYECSPEVVDASLAQKTEYITSWLSITFSHCIACECVHMRREEKRSR